MTGRTQQDQLPVTTCNDYMCVYVFTISVTRIGTRESVESLAASSCTREARALVRVGTAGLRCLWCVESPPEYYIDLSLRFPPLWGYLLTHISFSQKSPADRAARTHTHALLRACGVCWLGFARRAGYMSRITTPYTGSTRRHMCLVSRSRTVSSGV